MTAQGSYAQHYLGGGGAAGFCPYFSVSLVVAWYARMNSLRSGGTAACVGESTSFRTTSSLKSVMSGFSKQGKEYAKFAKVVQPNVRILGMRSAIPNSVHSASKTT